VVSSHKLISAATLDHFQLLIFALLHPDETGIVCCMAAAIIISTLSLAIAAHFPAINTTHGAMAINFQ
jgi:hypothetical protein